MIKPRVLSRLVVRRKFRTSHQTATSNIADELQLLR